uniref:Uncharacterized protein n=1 Tax=Magnetococcus massalia (strain MO-1) TaxID=451514 RepID=A0A1S7LGA4_MAGMO|nr:Protein of unknown function [Candidatus Magnetococcus massalia]CRH06089.1 Protein of unknown function [Candidatus Magnetococcus massalia]
MRSAATPTSHPDLSHFLYLKQRLTKNAVFWRFAVSFVQPKRGRNKSRPLKSNTKTESSEYFRK